MKKKPDNINHKQAAPTPIAKNEPKTLTFFQFVWNDASNRTYLWAGLGIGVVIFAILRTVFPIPSFYSDSYTYIGAAQENQLVSFRPIEYSRIIDYFHNFTTSDFALIFAQYFCNVGANLLLFFSLCYFLELSKWLKLSLFVLLLANPLYAIHSNYILSDSFFCGITVAWFTTLLYTIRKPQWWQFVAQLVLLLLLFKLRYNAIIFPCFITIAVLLSEQSKLNKAIWIVAGFFLVFLLMKQTTDLNEEYTNTKTFSPFSGWQLANDALHIIPYSNTDSSNFDDESREAYSYIKHYFDTVKPQHSLAPTNGVTAEYMWNNASPLKNYVGVYGYKYRFNNYFMAWSALGPVYYKMGQALIMQHPLLYCQHFILPNAKSYFLPELEAYGLYNLNQDSIANIAKDYYAYPTNKVNTGNNQLHVSLITPWKYLFGIINGLFLLISAYYFASGLFKKSSTFFNRSVLMYLLFYVGNFLFVVCLAPTVFRYHVFVITLCIGFSIALLHQIQDLDL